MSLSAAEKRRWRPARRDADPERREQNLGKGKNGDEMGNQERKTYYA